jgi:hypothetical protein
MNLRATSPLRNPAQKGEGRCAFPEALSRGPKGSVHHFVLVMFTQ